MRGALCVSLSNLDKGISCWKALSGTLASLFIPFTDVALGSPLSL